MVASQGRGRFYTKHAKAAKEEVAKTGRRATDPSSLGASAVAMTLWRDESTRRARPARPGSKIMVRFGLDSLGWEEAER
jgi:hypothetical protein